MEKISTNTQNKDTESLGAQHPALQRVQERLANAQGNPQLYSRMHHRHNRS